jgi:multidrug transporter EmrE-like cation transporter
MMAVAKITHQGNLPYMGGLALSTLIYAPQPYLFLKAMNFENMTAVNLIWNLTSDVMVTLMGIFYFGEKIAGLRWVAVGMALFSLCLFAYTDKD